MTRLTINVHDDGDVSFLKEMLDRIGLPYEVEQEDVNYTFSDTELEGFVKTKQDFLEGKTTARSWAEVKEDLDCAFNRNA